MIIKLYTINNICVSIVPISGTIDIKIDTFDGDNPENYINRKIIFSGNSWKNEAPSPEELNTTLTIYNTLTENQKLKTSLSNIEQYIIDKEIQSI